MYACSALSGTPARAIAAAGAARSAAGIEPQRSTAAARPGGRAVRAARRRPDVEDLRRVAEGHLGRQEVGAVAPGRRRGRAPRRRSRAASAPRPRPRRACSRRRPGRSAAARRPTTRAPRATAASTALPPSRSTRAPASALIGWPAATMPRAGRAHAAHDGEGRGGPPPPAGRRPPRLVVPRVDTLGPQVSGADHSRAFKDFEAAGWSRNAVGYGALTGRITAHVAGPLLDAARVAQGATVLDVGCGRGDLCAAAAARGARPTGVDLAGGMVAAAREAHPGLDFRVGDAEDLPFATARSTPRSRLPRQPPAAPRARGGRVAPRPRARRPGRRGDVGPARARRVPRPPRRRHGRGERRRGRSLPARPARLPLRRRRRAAGAARGRRPRGGRGRARSTSPTRSRTWTSSGRGQHRQRAHGRAAPGARRRRARPGPRRARRTPRAAAIDGRPRTRDRRQHRRGVSPGA